MKRITTITVFLIFIFSSFVFAQNLKEITVTIAPEAYIVKKITGNTIKVNTIIKGNLDPHNYEPKISDIKSLSNTKIYFTIGYPFEKTLTEKVKENYKGILFVNVANGIPFAEEHEHDTEEHEHDADLDPHYWTDPNNMLIISENIYNELILEYPEHRKNFAENYSKLVAEIKAIDSNFKKLFQKENNVAFIVYHPAFGYFAKNYGIKQLTIEREGKIPTTKHIKKVITEAKNFKTKLFIVQPEDNPEIVKVITKDLKLNRVNINIMTENWDELMKDLYKAFQNNMKN